MMLKKLLDLGQIEKNKVVKLLKKGILDFEPDLNQFYYVADDSHYKVEGESSDDFDENDDPEAWEDDAAEKKPKKVRKVVNINDEKVNRLKSKKIKEKESEKVTKVVASTKKAAKSAESSEDEF
jgi:hypothetical protein